MSSQTAALSFLASAIPPEVAATSALQMSDAATRDSWIAASAIGCVPSFRCLARAFRGVPPLGRLRGPGGPATTLVTLHSVTLFGERIAAPPALGLVPICVGIVALRTALLSRSPKRRRDAADGPGSAPAAAVRDRRSPEDVLPGRGPPPAPGRAEPIDRVDTGPVAGRS